MACTPIILFISILFSVLTFISIADDTLTADHTISDGKTIESAGGLFELGFFSPGKSKNRYLGVWYKKISTGTAVWVANRETPLTDTSGMLKINGQGNLVLIDGAESIIWCSNSSRSDSNSVAQLLDNGNLVLRHENDIYSENFLWQSFDYPGDHILPGVKFGLDLVRGLDRSLTSWKSPDDPSPGNFTNGVNPSGYPQLFLWSGPKVLFRSGPWDGIQFSGLSFPIPDQSFELKLVFNKEEIYYRYELINSSIVMRLVLYPNGSASLLHWIDKTKSWVSYLSAQGDECDRYAFCGSNGMCNITQFKLGSDPCGCLRGFEPKFPEKWKSTDRSSGCVRRTQLDCGNGDVFVKHSNLKLPDTQHSWLDPTMSLEDCQRRCLKNCSCTAYSNIDIRGGGTGCLLWFHDLIDIRDYSDDGLDLYVRMAAAELERVTSLRPERRNTKTIAIAVPVVLIVVAGLILVLVLKKKKKKLKGKLRRKGTLTRKQESDDTKELPLLDIGEIVKATNNFSPNNKLGEGGFGLVYKGVLDEGQEIAVKRFSKYSKQGLDEFKNEVTCIAKLQHRNLVRLLGCCIQEGEMLLIYEYMPNKSLDFFIFDKELSKSLDWSKRYNIINGVARGLLYLHQDSRLRIIHRDLKASNILLDWEMNSKISDFGIARSFRATEVEVNTRRVVGTYGYMSPEYAIDGLFSIKSDVYSFGVLVLEIVTGEKISSFYFPDENLNLLGYVWKLYKEGRFLELIDGGIEGSCKQFELVRVIQIGLLCVQPYSRDRPSMSFVVPMLGSETELPQPKQPGFYTERNLQNSSSSEPLSNDQLTVTFFAPR